MFAELISMMLFSRVYIEFNENDERNLIMHSEQLDSFDGIIKKMLKRFEQFMLFSEGV